MKQAFNERLKKNGFRLKIDEERMKDLAEKYEVAKKVGGGVMKGIEEIINCTAASVRAVDETIINLHTVSSDDGDDTLASRTFGTLDDDTLGDGTYASTLAGHTYETRTFDQETATLQTYDETATLNSFEPGVSDSEDEEEGDDSASNMIPIAHVDDDMGSLDDGSLDETLIYSAADPVETEAQHLARQAFKHVPKATTESTPTSAEPPIDSFGTGTGSTILSYREKLLMAAAQSTEQLDTPEENERMAASLTDLSENEKVWLLETESEVGSENIPDELLLGDFTKRLTHHEKMLDEAEMSDDSDADDKLEEELESARDLLAEELQDTELSNETSQIQKEGGKEEQKEEETDEEEKVSVRRPLSNEQKINETNESPIPITEPELTDHEKLIADAIRETERVIASVSNQHPNEGEDMDENDKKDISEDVEQPAFEMTEDEPQLSEEVEVVTSPNHESAEEFMKPQAELFVNNAFEGNVSRPEEQAVETEIRDLPEDDESEDEFSDDDVITDLTDFKKPTISKNFNAIKLVKSRTENTVLTYSTQSTASTTLSWNSIQSQSYDDVSVLSPRSESPDLLGDDSSLDGDMNDRLLGSSSSKSDIVIKVKKKGVLKNRIKKLFNRKNRKELVAC